MTEDWAIARERRKVWMEEQYTKYPYLLKYYKDKDDGGFIRSLCHGVEVPVPWLPNLEKLFEDLAEIKDLRLVQIKEKFGELRVYYEYHGHPFESNGWATTIDLIDMKIRDCVTLVAQQEEARDEEDYN